MSIEKKGYEFPMDFFERIKDAVKKVGPNFEGLLTDGELHELAALEALKAEQNKGRL